MASRKRTRTDPRRAAGPTVREMREQATRDGDVDALWAELTKRHFSMVDQEELFGLLLRALEVRGRRDPEAFAADNFVRMIGFVSYLMMRSTFYINHRIAQHGRATQTKGPADLPADVSGTLLPRIMDLQGHLAELLQAQAGNARQWELARAKRADNDRRAGGGGKSAAVRRERTSPASANGHSTPPKAPREKHHKVRRAEPPDGALNGFPEPPLAIALPVNRIGRYMDGQGSASEGSHGDE
ncbi:hypothetical protein EP7_003089 [Isosphaeraceae bacterium EP7]